MSLGLGGTGTMTPRNWPATTLSSESESKSEGRGVRGLSPANALVSVTWSRGVVGLGGLSSPVDAANGMDAGATTLEEGMDASEVG